MKQIAIIVALGLALIGGIVSKALADFTPVTFYVSPQGNDTNRGSTKDQPFATLQKAVDSAAQASDPDGAMIFLAKGTYFATEPIRIEKGSIALIGEGEESQPPEVTISSGRIITGFKEIEKGLVVVEIPDVKAGKWDFRDLYINGHRSTRARSPNEGYFRVEKSGQDRRTNFTYNEGDLKKWKDLDSTGLGGVELVFLHDWSITRCPIKEIDETERRLTVPRRIGCDLEFFYIDQWEPHPRYFVENSIEFLDAPGEWFLDTQEGKLFYLLKEGETADTLEVIAPVATQLLLAEGTAEHPIEVSLRNIRFAYAAYVPKPENTSWESQAASISFPGGPGAGNFRASPAAVHFEYVSGGRIDNCLFEHLGENGLWLARGCSQTTVSRSVFRDIGANGVMVGTHNPAGTTVECTVEKSLVEKTGQTIFGAIGIWVGFAQKTDINDNIIRNTPYGGISIGWQWNPRPTTTRENKIRNNLIYDCMLTLADSGGIYTLGYHPESVIEGNIIHSIPNSAGNAESNGIFLDEGTKGFLIRKNTIFNTAQSSIRAHRVDTNIVQDNILLNKPGVPTIRYNSTPVENLALIDNRDF